MFSLSRPAPLTLSLALGLGSLAVVAPASAAVDPVANATTTTVVATSSSTTLSGLSITDPTSTDLLQVTLSTDLGTLSIPSTATTNVTAGFGDTFTADASISFRGTVTNVNTALAAAQLNSPSATGTAHVTLSALVVDSGTAYNPVNGHYYQLVTGSTSYATAKTNAAGKTFAGLTGYLATPATADANNVIAAAFPTRNVWIGAEQTTSPASAGFRRTWSWATGPRTGDVINHCVTITGSCQLLSSDTAYNNWNAGEPNNGGLLSQEEPDAVMNSGPAGSLSGWNDVTASGSTAGGAIGGYVVEFGNQRVGTSTPPTGTTTATSAVAVATTPGAPAAVSLAAGDHAITATITAPTTTGNSAITGYLVTATPSTGPVVTASCAASPCTVSGLTNGTAYTVTVQARNAIGLGTATAGTSATPAGAPGAPSSVTATAGDGQASIAWTAPTANNGATIAGYTVTATPTAGGTAVTKSCSGSPCVVTGLTNGTAYAVTVHATSTLGVNGPESTPVTVTPAGRPSSGPTGLTAAAGDGQATLTFTPVIAQPSVSSYTATITPQGGSALPTQSCSGSGCTVTGLTNGTTYSITVHANNSAGGGPESSSVSVVPAGRPGAPTIGSVTRTNGGVSVTYTAGAANGPVPTFTLNAVPATGSGGAAPSVTCTSSPCAITGLTNGVSYTFTVTATGATGLAATSGASSPPVTAASVPAAPASITETDGSGSATLTFTAPAANGDPITGYQFSTNAGSTFSTLSTSTSGSTVTATVTGLANGSAASILIRAVNAIGNSANSVAVAANPAALPTAPTNPAAQRINGGARITFTPPANPATAAVTGYTVTAIPSSGASTTTSCSASPCDVTGLTNGTSYRFTVVATNRIGSSPASGQTGAITAAQVPAAPSVTAAPRPASVVLTITAGAANGDAVTGYTVTTSPAPAGGATTTCGTTGTCTITGLTNGTAYTFSVVATNGIGSSAAATATATPQAVPGALTGGQAKPGNDKVVVSFDTPTSGTFPTTYEYSFDGTTWTTASNVVDTNGRSSFDITAGVSNGTPAHVYVRGQSTYGPGPTLDLGTVTPVALPGQPTGVSASRIDGGAQISFVAPTSTTQSPVTGYTVTAYPSDGSPSTSVTCSSGPCTINGLTVGTGYTFSVTATNGNGGTESARTPALTIAGHPGVPTAVSAAAKDGSAVVSFTAPSDTGGDAITGYTVTASPGGASATCTASPCTVTGLANGTTYSFAVTATNSLGTSAASAASTAVTPQPVPAALSGGQLRPGDGTVTVSFTTPAAGTTAPTTYEYSLDGTTWLTATNVVDTNGTSAFTISGLPNGTPVDVRLRGVSSYGNGAAVDLGPVTPALPPGAPGAPTAMRQSNGDVRVSFTPPASDGGSAITGYEYTTDGGTTWHTLTYTGTSPLTGTITGLTNGTTYQIATRAVTPAGHSDPSAIITVVAASAPGAPALGTVTPHDGSADVAFTAPADTGGDAITSYTVTATPQGGSGSPVTVTCTASPCTVPGLANGTAYTFAVSATNGVGTSAASAPSGAVTPRSVPGQLTGAVAAAGDHTATITFATPSASDPTRPTSYEYSVDSGAWQPAGAITVNGDGTSTFTVSGLVNGTTVHLDVRGVSSYGNGVRTNLGTVTPSAPPPPGVPGSPTAVRQTTGDVRLTFAAPTGTAPTGYEYNLGDGTGWHTLSTTGTSPVTGTVPHGELTEGTTYAITVRADHGSGAPSDPSTAVNVTAAAAPDAPTTVTATPRAESVRLSFAVPNSHGSTILGYDYSTDGIIWTPLTYAVSGSTVTGTVLGLSDGSPYAYRVRASNTVGSSSGTATTPASVTPLAGPTAPASGSVSVTPVPGGATVSFTPPSGNGTTSAPTGYEYSQDGGVTWQALTTSGTSPLTGTITGLTNGTTYSVSVRGTSSYGSGSATTPVSITPQGRPAAPSAPAVSVSGTTATVSWTPGNTGGAGVVTYTVTASPSGGSCTTTGTSCAISGLAAGGVYTFTVTPTNSLGTGTSSPGVLISLASPAAPGTTTPGAAAWYTDPVSAAARLKEVKVPGAPKRYHGKKKATVATYRAANGQFVVPATTPAGRPLHAGQGVQFAMKSLFKGSSVKLTKRGQAQVRTIAASLRSVAAIRCEGYTDYTLAHGKKLSSKRAAAVCRALVADGIRVAVASHGYAGKRPQVLAKRPGARAANNRIVVQVTAG